MELDNYKNVIRRVYDKCEGQPFEVFYDRLIDSLEIAADLMGTTAVAPPRTRPSQSLAIPVRQETKADPFKGAIILSAAPPVAGATESEDDTAEEVDYWETKPGKGDGCNRLESKLKSVLPLSIEVQLPGFDKTLTLNRGVSGPGVKFVNVTYTLAGSQEAGPRYVCMTGMKPESIDADAIMADILSQATAMYSKEKRTIVPHAAPPQSMPSSQELQRMLEKDRREQGPNDGVSGEDAVLARQEAQQWSQSRPERWR